MANKNFNDIIQDAIDSQDYSALSSAVQNLVTDAVTDALGEIGDNVNKAADIIAGRGNAIDRRPDYMKNKQHTVEPAQNPWKGNGLFEKHLGAKDLNKEKLFSNGGLSRVKGYLLAIFGIIGLSGSILSLLTLFIIGSLAQVGMLPAKIILMLIIAGFGFMTWKGVGILKKINRFRNYLKTIGDRNRVSVKELAGANGKTEKDTVKDVQDMIHQNMFLQGHLNAEQSELYVTDSAYEEYLEELKVLQKKAEEEEIQRILGFEKAEKERIAREKAEAGIPVEVRKLLTDGYGYINLIRSNNDAIEDAAVTEKLKNLEGMTEQIFGYVKEHPESADETKKLMKYYLPTTIKLLESYQKLTEAEEAGVHPEQAKNIAKSKREIEETLDTLNQAFVRLFDNLYQDTSMDISADISVLNTLLAQEGLVGNGIKETGVNQEVKNQEQVLQSH